MISTRPATRTRRAIQMPTNAAPKPAAPKPPAIPIAPSDVWDRVDVSWWVQPRSKFAEAVKYLKLQTYSFNSEGWAEVRPTLDELMLAIAYAQRFSGDAAPPEPKPTPKPTPAPLKVYGFGAPIPDWGDDDFPLPEGME